MTATLPANRPDLAFPFYAIAPALVAAAALRAPGIGWAAAVCAVAAVLFGIAAMIVERATGNRSGPVSAFLDACAVPASAIGYAAFGGFGAFFAMFLSGVVLPRDLGDAVFGTALMPIPAGCAVLAAHLGAVEVIRNTWRGLPVDAAANRTASAWSRWTPGDGVTGLDGDDLPADEVYFVEPPPEIGPVLYADSTLRADYEPLSGGQTAAYAAMLVGAMGVAGTVAAAALTSGDTRSMLTFLILSVLLALYEAWRLACPRHLCGFVGWDGGVRYSMRTPGGAVCVDRVVLFADATHAYIGETRTTVGRWHDYGWTDANGYEFVSLRGERAEADRAVALPVNFARAAYRAWIDRQRERMGETYRATGKAVFPIRHGDSIELDDAGLTLAYGGRAFRAAWADVTARWRWGKLTLGGLERVDGGPPGKRVSVTVPGDRIADRRLLAELVEGMITRHPEGRRSRLVVGEPERGPPANAAES